MEALTPVGDKCKSKNGTDPGNIKINDVWEIIMVINLEPDSFNSKLTKTEKQLNKLKHQMVSAFREFTTDR